MHSCHVRWLFALALATLPAGLRAQDATGVVRGRVTDAATNQPLAGVTVAVDGTQLGALTSDQGEYTLLAVPAGQRTLRARRIGYSAETRVVSVAAGETVTADFSLRAAAVALEQVVVTGTAAPTTRRALGTSLATIDSAAVARSGAVTVDAALQGKVAGAQIVQNSGNPGGGGISVRLRGTSSIISGSEPLYIVDGVIVDNSSTELRDLGARGNVQNRLADINPGDIERIEVIRGAAAAALYGSRANNGVVQIFTKRGQAGRPRITLQTRYSANELRRPLGMNLYPFNNLGQPVTRYDYQDQIFTTGNLTDNTLSVEGGNEQTTYFVSGSWYDEDGIQPNSGATRRGARINLGQQVYPRLRFDVGANFVNSQNDFLPNGERPGGVITALVFTPTTFNFFPDSVGTYPRAPTGANFANPLRVIEEFRQPQEVNRFIGSVRGRFTPLDNLALDYTLGYDGYQQEGREFIPRGALGSGQQAANGLSATVIRDSRIIDQNGVATLTTRPAGDVELGTSVGFNYTQQTIQSTTAAAFELLPLGDLVSAGATPAAAQSAFDLVTLGFYGQQTAAWRNRLFLTGALRWDASSTFGPNERWQLFPKVSASYVISEEDWFANGGLGQAFSSLRLRSALGYAGNQPSPRNAYARENAYVRAVNDGRAGFVNSITLGNEDLKPERQREFEFGADVGFLDDRLSLEATYYDKLVEDLLLFRPVATTTGYFDQFANIGAMSNRGVELLARSTNVDQARFGWSTTLTYTRNRNRVEKLTIPPFVSAAGYPNRVEEGQPVGVFYGQYYVRNDDGSLRLDSLGRPTPSGAANQRILGDPNPDWLGSILNEIRVGQNVRFRVLFDGSFGGDVLNLTRRIQDIFGTGVDAERELLPFGDPRKLPAGYLLRRGPATYEEYVEDGSFVKLRELSASYTFDAAPVRRIFSQGIDLTLAGRNLYVWTDYSGYDPELNLFGQATVDRGFDFAAFPIPRTWSLSARITY